MGVSYPHAQHFGAGRFAGQAPYQLGRIQLGQPSALAALQHVQQPREQLLGGTFGVRLGVGHAREHEHAGRRVRLGRGGHGQARLAHVDVGLDQPQAVAQLGGPGRHGRSDEAGPGNPGIVQTGGCDSGQPFPAGHRHPRGDGGLVQPAGHRRLGQQADNGLGIVGGGQFIGHAGRVQHVGELAQDIQMLIAGRGDGHDHVHLITVVPGHALGKLQYAQAGVLDQT